MSDTRTQVLQKSAEQLGYNSFTANQQRAFEFFSTDNSEARRDLQFTQPSLQPLREKAFSLYGADKAQETPGPRMCAYYPTGTGKTDIALVSMALEEVASGRKHTLVVAPPMTHPRWEEDARKLGLEVTTVSHEKFRSKDFKLNRDENIIIDEFHKLGGVKGMGFRKARLVANKLRAAMIILSATPNYNDVERVFCVQQIVAPRWAGGNFKDWLNKFCITRENPFSATPDVEEIRDFKSVEQFLACTPGVIFVPDESPNIVRDVVITSSSAGLDPDLPIDFVNKRLIASAMELSQKKSYYSILASNRRARREERGSQQEPSPIIPAPVWHAFKDALRYAKVEAENRGEPIKLILYFQRSTLLHEFVAAMQEGEYRESMKEDLDGEAPKIFTITGENTHAWKAHIAKAFKMTTEPTILAGTSTMATGFDGLDKVCHTMLIVDDVPDDSLRKQLVGRIKPRGVFDASAYEGKRALRIVVDQ